DVLAEDRAHTLLDVLGDRRRETHLARIEWRKARAHRVLQGRAAHRYGQCRHRPLGEPLLEAARAYLVPETAVRHGDEEAPRVFRLDEIAQRSVLPLRHRSTRIRLSDQRARLELPRIRALQVPSAVDYERLSILGQDVLQD